MQSRRTIIHQIHVDTVTGSVHLWLNFVTLENGKPVAGRLHETILAPNTNVDAAINVFNRTTDTLGPEPVAPIESDRIPMLKAICEIAWSPAAAALREPGIVELLLPASIAYQRNLPPRRD